MFKELLKRNKQNLNVRPSGARCSAALSYVEELSQTDGYSGTNFAWPISLEGSHATHRFAATFQRRSAANLHLTKLEEHRSLFPHLWG